MRRIRSLPRRAWLTLKYLGPGQALLRAITFPLRPTPIGRWLGYGRSYGPERVKARRWYREHGRDVTIVIPTYGDPAVTIKCVRSLRRTTDKTRTRIIVCDDASPNPEHRRRLARLRGAAVIQGDERLGFARNANRGLRRAAGDVVLLNSDIVAHRGWMETLQQAAYERDDIGMAAPKLLYPDGRIQSAGSHRNLGAPEWFDHRYRFQEATYGPANVPAPVLAATAAALYVKRDTIERIGVLDDDYEMAFEDADWCLRCWQAGLQIVYQPYAELTHLESVTRGMAQGERELASRDLFWSRWGDFFDRRDVRTDDGRLRVVYVTYDTSVGGGHRDVFEHLNRLVERGQEAELWTTRNAGPPDWFDLRAPVRSFARYADLVQELEPLDAIKVATWWATAPHVWLASVRNGIPAFFVQDIETSYYPDRPEFAYRVVDSYRHEFRYMTISEWNRERLAEYGVQARLVPPGVNLDLFREYDDVRRRDDELLVVGRANPLKNLPLTMAAYDLLGDDRPRMRMFGVEPKVGERYGIEYVESPPDEEVARMFARATVFVQTSVHEGFCLPPLEAMAAGCAVVCTDAHGNRDFCRDGENCLMPEPTPEAVAEAIRRLFEDRELRERLIAEGKRTAAAYAWDKRTDELEAALEAMAAPGPAASPAKPTAPIGDATAAPEGAG
ncbi:MAG: glycosyltransferase [Solirubrobacterales bacterium]